MKWKKKFAATGAVVAIVAASLMGVGAQSALAQGGFTQKVTMWGCTQTDFLGHSDRTQTQAKAYTQHNNVVCVGKLRVGARASAGGVTGSAAYRTDGNVTAYVNAAGTAYGWHQICQGDAVNGWSGCVSRST